MKNEFEVLTHWTNWALPLRLIWLTFEGGLSLHLQVGPITFRFMRYEEEDNF